MVWASLCIIHQSKTCRPGVPQIQQGELPGDLTHDTQGRGLRQMIPLRDCPN
jgi:hypothetical protein